MSDKKYWQSFGERNNSEAFQKSTEDEFNESLPLEGLDGKGLLDAKHPRRDFLKYLGFSTAAATLAASCEMPVRHVVPYLNKPENTIPGVADYYATTYTLGGDIVSLVAKVRDGRPIKAGRAIRLSSLTKGGTSARVQASVLDLYDTARLRYPGTDCRWQTPGSEHISKLSTSWLSDALAAAAGAPLVLLTGTLTSPTTKQIITAFLAKFPGSKHVQYDADSYSGLLLAGRSHLWQKGHPSYRFDKAQVIVSLGADFLGTWLTPGRIRPPVRQGTQRSMRRTHDEQALPVRKSAVPDGQQCRRPVYAQTKRIRRSRSGPAGRARRQNQLTAPALPEKVKAGVKKAAKELMDNKGKGLVVSGSNNVNIQIIVNAINEAIGARCYGRLVCARSGPPGDRQRDECAGCRYERRKGRRPADLWRQSRL
jgi:MoCo/4Fe-4S cofactor protein with predicted Tat translocation signal